MSDIDPLARLDREATEALPYDWTQLRELLALLLAELPPDLRPEASDRMLMLREPPRPGWLEFAHTGRPSYGVVRLDRASLLVGATEGSAAVRDADGGWIDLALAAPPDDPPAVS